MCPTGQGEAVEKLSKPRGRPVWTRTEMHMCVCTHITHTSTQRLIPLEPREATTKRTPLVLSTGSRSWCCKREAVCVCNLELRYNPWLSCPEGFFYVWLELKGPSWNSDSLTGRLSRLSEASPPLTLPMKSPSNHSHPA